MQVHLSLTMKTVKKESHRLNNMNVYLIVHPVVENIKKYIKKPAYVIAVDQGLFDAYKQAIDVDLAIGDFDSLNDKSLLDTVQSIRLDSKKDYTDTESAILHAQKLNPKHIYMLGGLGGLRVEHSYANILLTLAYDNLTIITDQTTIGAYPVGTYTIQYDGYINIFSASKAVISLEGFKYDVKNYKLNYLTRLGISNELKQKTGVLSVKVGKVIVMYTNKDQ